MNVTWGRKPSRETAYCWGARAIFLPHDKRRCIDLLPNRQGMNGEHTPEQAKALVAWVNAKGLKALEPLVRGLPTSSSEVCTVEQDGFVLEACPNASYGYLYLCAYPDTKLFRLVKPETNEDVMGGTLTRDNVYVRTYGARLPGEKPVDDLELGEHSEHEYRLSGSKGTYWIVRVA